MAPCEPLREKEEGHCHEQVESPICCSGNAEYGISRFFMKCEKREENMGLIPKGGGESPRIKLF